MSDIDADVLLRAYAYGVFPMAESRTDPELYWIDPEKRGILPLDAFHVPSACAAASAPALSISVSTPRFAR